MSKLKINTAPKTRFSIAMPIELARESEEMSFALGINRNAFINLAISTFIENKKIAQSMESVSNGMIERFNIEFDKILKQSIKSTDKVGLKKG